MTLSKERIDDESLQGLIDMRRERVEYCKEEGLRASLILNEAMLSALTELLERRERDKQRPIINVFFKDGWPVEGTVGVLYSARNVPDGAHDFYAAPPAPAPVVPPVQVPDAIEPTYEAIKAILPTANPDEYACCIAADMWNACRAAMLKPSQWIPCSEQMPEKGERDIWLFNGECVQHGYVYNGRSFVDWNEEYVELTGVTHWMSMILPAAPQEPTK